MKNLFSFTFVLALAGVPLVVAAQVNVPTSSTIAVETSASSPTSLPAAPAAAPAPAVTEENPNVVLFTGTVKQERLKALPGATIYVKSTRQLAVADENGDFSLELDFSNGPLDIEVSYAGFNDQSVTISDPNTFLVVSMLNRKKK